MRNFLLVILIGTALISCGPSYDQTIEIESIGNQMKYNVPEIKAQKGSTLQIILSNNASMEIMKHNIVVLNSVDAIDEVGKQAISAENYLPSHESIIAASEMIGPGETTELVVQIPNEKGIYPYICTFPGHYQVMQGRIIVE